MHARRRLNLFAFPAETNALFGMLIVSSITLALFLGYAFGVIFGLSDSLASINMTIHGLEATRTFLPLIFVSSSAVLLVLGMAVFFYLRHPETLRRRRKLNAITEKDQEIQTQVNQLAFQAEMAAPLLEMPLQGFQGSDAQAFGIGKHQRIALDGGFRILRKTKTAVFNALIRHELAHFANGDIGKSYFSDALWKSIRWVIILPFVLGLLGNVIIGIFLGVLYGDILQRFIGAAQVIFKLLVQFSFVMVVAASIWARLLRTREFYADWRAVLWGSQAGLESIFKEQHEKPKKRFRLWNLHPDAEERMSVIEHPEILFNLSLTVVFLAGLLLAFLFVGLQFSLSTFLAFAGILQTIRDSSTGWLYWLARGALWLGIICLFLLVFGMIVWLINGVLLPQIQKQTALELTLRSGKWTPYLKLFQPALILVTGIEIGFFMTPADIFAPNDWWGIILELFIIAPLLVLIAWWYLIYMRFISLRLSTTQIGRNFSVWRSRFSHIATTLWGFLFFIPGLFLSRFLSGELLEVFMYASLIWLASTCLFSLTTFGASWVAISLLFDNELKKCPHCGKITQHTAPAIELCEHCGGTLGEWLFVTSSDE